MAPSSMDDHCDGVDADCVPDRANGTTERKAGKDVDVDQEDSDSEPRSMHQKRARRFDGGGADTPAGLATEPIVLDDDRGDDSHDNESQDNEILAKDLKTEGSELVKQLNGDLKAFLAKSSGVLAAREKEVKALKGSLEKQQKKLDNMSQASTSRASRKQGGGASKGSENAEVAKLKDDLQKSQDTCSELRQELSETEAQVSALEDRVHELEKLRDLQLPVG